MITHNLDLPSAWVERFAPFIPKDTPLGDHPVLDLACGGGRHSRFLAKLGYSVYAVDQSQALLDLLKNGLEDRFAQSIQTHQADLEGQDWPLENMKFSGIVVTNYLYRPRFKDLLKLLIPNGVLIYETFALGNEVFGKPSNPDFLLKPHELLDLIRADEAFQILDFEQGIVDRPKPASIQRICAVRSHGIPLQLPYER